VGSILRLPCGALDRLAACLHSVIPDGSFDGFAGSKPLLEVIAYDLVKD
jgi:hypothetical protein